MNTIQYEVGVSRWKKHKEQIIVDKEAVIQEIKETMIECLDATDINYLAAEAGITPNEVRGLMLKPNDPHEAFMAEIHSFENDETDAIFEYY